MSLKEPVLVGRQPSKSPSLAIKGVSAGVGNKKLAVMSAHGVWKAAAWEFSIGKHLRGLPISTPLVFEHAKTLRSATYIQLSLVAGDAVESAINAWLTTVFPLRP